MQSLRSHFVIVAAFTLLLAGVWISNASAICQSTAAQNEISMVAMPCCAGSVHLKMAGTKTKPCNLGMASLSLCAASNTSSTLASKSAPEIAVPAPALTGQVHSSFDDIGRFFTHPPFQRHTPLLPPPLHQVRLII